MSQVIKVDRELYQVLKERARDKGITIKGALPDLLEEERAKVEELRNLLSRKEKELRAMRERHAGEVSEYKLELSSLEEEVQGLREELSRHKARVEELASALEEAEREAKEHEAMAYLLLPLGVTAGLFLSDFIRERDPRELLFSAIGGAIGGLVGYQLEGAAGALAGVAVGALVGEIALYLLERRKRREWTLWAPQYG